MSRKPLTNKDILAAQMTKRAGLSRILTGLPLVGGAMHGLIDPVEGSPRGTSLFYEGLGGGLGSILGGIGGSLAFKDDYDRPGLGGLAGGGVLGSVVGSHLGRWLADRGEDPEIEQLRKLIAKLEKGEGLAGTGVVVNVGQAQHGGGPTAAAEQQAQEAPDISRIEVEIEEDQEDLDYA